MCVRAVDGGGWFAQVVSLWVMMEVLSHGLLELDSRGLSMVVPGEDLGKSVSHLQLPVEGAVELSVRVETAVLAGTLRSWRLLIVDVLIRQVGLELVVPVNEDGRVLT